MAEINQFGTAGPGLSAGRKDCLRYEAMLADVVDGELSAEDQAAFDLHLLTCESCSAMLTDAQHGLTWLDMLRPYPPEPSNTLIDRILAVTSVRAAEETEAAALAERKAADATSLLGRPVSAAVVKGATARGEVLSFPARVTLRLRPALNTVLQTRFAMTAAMAFFSIALTSNLLGVHLTALRAHDLSPSNLRRNFYEANAHVVRYYENLRVVYELESRVRDLQRAPEPDSGNPHAEPQAAQPGSGAPGAAGQGDGAEDGKKKSAPGHPRSSTELNGNAGRQSSAGERNRSQPPGQEPALPVLASYCREIPPESRPVLSAAVQYVPSMRQRGDLV